MYPRSTELQFSTELFQRYLQKHPDEATELAIAYFEDFSNLAIKYRELERSYRALQAENIELKSLKTHKSISLPPFLKSNKGAS